MARSLPVLTILGLLCAACGGSPAAPAPPPPAEVAAVPRGPMWEQYVRDARFAQIRFVMIEAGREHAALSPERVQALIGRNRDALLAELEAERHRFVALPPQRRVRHVLFELPSDASDEDRSQLRARVVAARERLRSGEDFGALARAESDLDAARGGDLGWVPRGRLSAPLDEAVFALAIGEISDVIESRLGFHVLRVEAEREGDVPENEVLPELVGQHPARWLALDFLERRRSGVAWDELVRELDGERVIEHSPRTDWVRWRDRLWGREVRVDDHFHLSNLIGESSLEDPLPAEPYFANAAPREWAGDGGFSSIPVYVVFEVLDVREADPAGLTPAVRACLQRRLDLIEQLGGLDPMSLLTGGFVWPQGEAPRCVPRP